MWNLLIREKEVVREEKFKQVNQQNGYQMILLKNVEFVKVTSIYLGEDIIVEIVESKNYNL